MSVVSHAFIITVDSSGVWSVAQVDQPGLGTTKPDGMWFNEAPLSVNVQGLSIHHQNRLHSLDAALAFVRECVAGLAARLLSDKP